MSNKAEERGLIEYVILGFCCVAAVAFIFSLTIGVDKMGPFGDSFGPLTSLFSGLAAAIAYQILMNQRVEMDRLQKHALTAVFIEEWFVAARRATNAGTAYERELLPEMHRAVQARMHIDFDLFKTVVFSDFQSKRLFQGIVVRHFLFQTNKQPRSEIKLHRKKASELLNAFSMSVVDNGPEDPTVKFDEPLEGLSTDPKAP